VRLYLLAGLLRCGTGYAVGAPESSWANGRAAYRCRHGHPSAARPDPGRPKNVYVREDQILSHLAAMAILLAGRDQDQGHRKQGAAQLTTPPQTAEVIDYLRSSGLTLTYDPQHRTLRSDTEDAVAVTVARSR